MKYLREFVIGSSYIVFLPFYYSVYNQQPKKNYRYYHYTLTAPVWLGVWNVISLILAEIFNLTMRQRYIVVAILSSLNIMILATLFQTYQFSCKEWMKYYLKIFIKYLLVWNVVVYNIEKYI